VATAIPKALVDDLVERCDSTPGLVRDVLRSLADAAADAVEYGDDFTVPGIVKLQYAYRPAQKKGARWAKGDTVTGFGGIESVKDEASPPVTAQIKLRANLTGDVRRLKPSAKPDEQTAFIKSKAGKNVVSRKRKG
jgi:hypothetical protein